MLLWFFALALSFQGARLLLGRDPWNALQNVSGIRRERERLAEVIARLHTLEELLEAGVVPESKLWDGLRSLAMPWGPLAHESLTELRSSGGSVLPTLRRLRALAEEHQAALSQARARAAQALVQAGACGALVPVFSLTLYWFLPGLDQHPEAWLAGSLLAALMSALAMLWLLSMAERARWGGLPVEQRSWILAALCAGERFLGLVRSGTPSDLAWTRAHELLLRETPELAALWGASVWRVGERPASRAAISPAGAVIAETGNGIRNALQISLMEGRSCLERVEAALKSLKQDFQALVERELSLLATRALQPLFIGVAPSILGLLAFGLYLGWEGLWTV